MCVRQSALTHPFHLSFSQSLTSISLLPAVHKGKQRVIALQHTFMVKHIAEDTNGDISLVGTFIQKAAGMSMVEHGEEGEVAQFSFNKFRFNDVSATDNDLEIRRTTPIEKFGTRTTMNARFLLFIGRILHSRML
jgi:hypothetical protein